MILLANHTLITMFNADASPGGGAWTEVGHWGTHGGGVRAGAGTGGASGVDRRHGVPVSGTVLGNAESVWAYPETVGGVSKPEGPLTGRPAVRAWARLSLLAAGLPEVHCCPQ